MKGLPILKDKVTRENLQFKATVRHCVRNLWLGLLKHDYFLAIANLREKSKPGSFDMYADFTSGDGRLLVTFPASWANIDHCMGQPLPTCHSCPASVIYTPWISITYSRELITTFNYTKNKISFFSIWGDFRLSVGVNNFRLGFPSKKSWHWGFLFSSFSQMCNTRQTISLSRRQVQKWIKS